MTKCRAELWWIINLLSILLSCCPKPPRNMLWRSWVFLFLILRTKTQLKKWHNNIAWTQTGFGTIDSKKTNKRRNWYFLCYAHQQKISSRPGINMVTYIINYSYRILNFTMFYLKRFNFRHINLNEVSHMILHNYIYIYSQLTNYWVECDKL